MNNKKIIGAVVLVSAAVLFLFIVRGKKPDAAGETVMPQRADLKSVISITGVVQPMNRLEIKPPVAGRMESILVKEGDSVTEGQVLAYLSSTERSALMDMAKSKGSEELKKWKELYKPIPVSAPIDGTVIVRSVEPGQSVGTSDAVIVLSDRLIVKAQADETDIGKIKKGQKAVITIDAYPLSPINGKVEHISYESTTAGNVTVYEVLVLPVKIPDFFRSGMSATVEITEKKSENALVIPSLAVKTGSGGKFVIAMKESGPSRIPVETGITEKGLTEIISGITEEDRIAAGNIEFKKAKNDNIRNPLMPERGRRR